MFVTLRSIAPAVLLLGILSGQAATGIVVGHVASEHVTRAGHGHHDAPYDHPAHHDGGAAGGPAEQRHDSEHAHECVAAEASLMARTVSPLTALQPGLLVVREPRLDLPDGRRFTVAASSLLRGSPPEPRRNSILLL